MANKHKQSIAEGQAGTNPVALSTLVVAGRSLVLFSVWIGRGVV